ncbi:RAS-related GTP-binding protein Rab11 [Spraguea lophii 42_110]|uniref:RAS-related GTP-binding protein Rab11 n=1 Tax=Spraguea lophii (strain 42_110) TaxID=1358809 RepID=S7W8I7_SPRLO|nr:RAS-related GTP-binding protein Rab11 [Spraguea lophii 42_110]
MRAHEHYDYLFKVVLIGDSSVGKTNLLSQLTRNEFSKDTKTTIGVEFATKTFNFEENIVKAQIWDTAGQERYRAITTAYYRGTLGAMVVYDITKKRSFNNCFEQWLTQLKLYSPENITIMLVGNKSDLEEEREISQSIAEDKAVKNDLSFFETSALTGDNVNAAFEALVRKVYERNKVILGNKSKIPENLQKSEPVKIVKKKKKKNICC